MTPFRPLTLLPLLPLALLAACKPAPDAAPAADAPTASAETQSEAAHDAGHHAAMADAPAAGGEASVGPLRIRNATSRETPLAGGTGPGFLEIENTGSEDDRLLSATSPATRSMEIHEMVDTDGRMQMRALPAGLPIPAGATVRLAPGGLHLMLIGVNEALVAGQTVPVELRFEKAGAVTVPLTVLARSAH